MIPSRVALTPQILFGSARPPALAVGLKPAAPWSVHHEVAGTDVVAGVSERLRRPKTSAAVIAVWIVSILVNVGMWSERFIIVITSLHRDFLPSSWGMYYPTQWDWAVLTGTIGFFLVLMVLFVRVLPSISIFEVREVLHHLAPHMLDDGKTSPSPAHGD